MPELELTATEQAMLASETGPAAQFALRIVLQVAQVMGAQRLIPVVAAHIDSCLYHGRAGLDFAERLVALGGRVAVPTTLNVGGLDLVHADYYQGDAAHVAAARRQMEAYLALGCQPSWTCAPYQLAVRPSFGQQIAWAESNAIVFANSVLGARTARYGDFLDICAAIVGLVPDAGLHRTAERRATVVFTLGALPAALLRSDLLYPLLGYVVGRGCGNAVPAIVGLPAATSEDQLKALGAAAAASGAVALFHAVGITPEAPTLADALHGEPAARQVDVLLADLIAARDALSTAEAARLTAVSLGTPHSSLAEFGALVALLADQTIHPDVDFWVSTGRDVLAEVRARGWDVLLQRAGVRVVVDTCTYFTPIMRPRPGLVLTNSAKWAYYAPGNIGVRAAIGSTHECVQSALRGALWRDPTLWEVA